MDSDYSDSDTDVTSSSSEESGSESSDNEFEMCCQRGKSSCGLPFDMTNIEKIILAISDKFDFRVLMNNERMRGAVMVTTGLAIAGGLIGKHFGGNVGAAVGGAVGGACGLGVVAVSMRDIWKDIKKKLSELFDIVYDYLAGLGIEDYKKAAILISENSVASSQLANIIVEFASEALKKQVVSNMVTG